MAIIAIHSLLKRKVDEYERPCSSAYRAGSFTPRPVARGKRRGIGRAAGHAGLSRTGGRFGAAHVQDRVEPDRRLPIARVGGA
ncbi:hypothetical protein G6F50_018227 [Rhizopus delemar]|uniref:Uncharacterized protein n=1 Tax=Rhizopus delemar TaxID=936053 RepID=A0A9P6XMZ5_9FUNG|nr:hypothetical protein G6F50_018227 [Rhizopus delemar]